MEARRYKRSDKELMDSWYEDRGMTCIPDSLLPEVGYIVDGMAVGFLYVTDGGVALIENYMTPEEIHFQDRSDALDAVTKALVEHADHLGVQRLIALTQAQAIYNRALKYGFDDIGNFRVVSKDLSDRKIKG